jgi:hypothetical protein
MQTSIVDRLLKNMGNMHELGRQRAFELGNPFYANLKKMASIIEKKCQPEKSIWLRSRL